MSAALTVEWLKFRRARTVWVTSAFLVAGIPAMAVLTLVSVNGSNPLLATKAQAIVGAGGWPGLFAGANTIVSVGGLLGFGVVIAWVFGREFTDGTIGGISSLPVSRAAIAAAKLLILLLWAVSLALMLTGALLMAGAAANTGAIGPGVLGLTGKFATISALTALLAFPCAWAATAGRGYLAGIGTIIAIVIAAQMAVLAGAGRWFPFAAPGLWATRPGVGADTATVVQLALAVPLATAAAGITLHAWRRLNLSG